MSIGPKNQGKSFVKRTCRVKYPGAVKSSIYIPTDRSLHMSEGRTQKYIMDPRLLAALVSSIMCEVAIILLLLNTSELSSPPSPSFSSNPAIWPILTHIFQSSQTMAAALALEEEEQEEQEEEEPHKPRKKKRRVQVSPTNSPHGNQEIPSRKSNGILFRMDGGFLEAASFKANFKMSPTTFEWLCRLVEPMLERREGLTSGVPIKDQVAIGLFRLASGSTYLNVSRRFGTTEPTARFCTRQLCRVLCTDLKHWVAYPSASALQRVMAEFQTISGLPNCCGAIDCTRFRIAEEEDGTGGPGNGNGREARYRANYRNEDCELRRSVVAQIVVDCSSRILSIVTGFNGEKGDSRVLRSSALYADVQEGRMLNSPPLYLKGIAVPQYLVGDSGYPLLPWLMVPYTDPVVTSCQEDFNGKHYLMRQAVLRALLCLRRWGILSKPIAEDVRAGVACIGACAILHNILLMREDGAAVLEGTEDYALHDQSSQYYRDANKEECSIEKKASLIRNALAVRARDMQNPGQASLQ